MWQLSTLKRIRINIFLIWIFFDVQLCAQTPFVNTNPFPSHFFIENKGQFYFNSEFSSAPEFELNDNACDIQIFKTGFSSYCSQVIPPS